VRVDARLQGTWRFAALKARSHLYSQ
jgi:hypothetical protein